MADEATQPRQLHPAHLLAQDVHGARRGEHDRGAEPQQRALAGSVGAEQRPVFAGVDGERDAVDDLLAVATERHVGEFENRCHADWRCRNTSSALSAWVSMLTSLAITSSTVRSLSITNVVRLTGMNLPSRPRLTPNCVATVPSASDSSG